MPLPWDVLRAALLFAVLFAAPTRYGPPQPLATLSDRAINESSGVAASLRRPGVYWTHNDSGDSPRVYAFDTKGRALGRWTLEGAKAADWEDIAIGPGPRTGVSYLYLGDIGDNSRVRRTVTVYRVPEPNPRAKGCRQGCRTSPVEAFELRYSDGPRDAEALLVHPGSGDLYIVAKALGDHETTDVFRAPAPLRSGAVIGMTKVAKLDIPDRIFIGLVGGITGGAISPDGTRVALCDYMHAYEAILPPGASFDGIWKQPFERIPLGIGEQHEGICYRRDGRALVVTSEGRPCKVSQLERSTGLEHRQ